MANVTDPLALIRGSDPQNLMEYIVRQKIYDSRFWKEECFGLSTVDVLEKAATSLQNIGGTFGGNRRPTKFLCLTLKLLQLQPELSLIEQFIQQDHFKYVKALGAFYLRLVGRPHEIYELLEPLYKDFSKLKYRDVTEWKLLHMDEFIDQIFTQPIVCGIALPRLPARATLLEAGYSLTPEDEEDEDNGNDDSDNQLYRPTALKEAIHVAGGLEAYLKYKVVEEKSPPAIELWQRRHPESKITTSKSKTRNMDENDEEGQIDETMNMTVEKGEKKGKDRKHAKDKKKKKAKTKTKKRKYGTLFKDDAVAKDDDGSSSSGNSDDDDNVQKPKSKTITNASVVEEGSEEYWNLEREKLGLKPLRK